MDPPSRPNACRAREGAPSLHQHAAAAQSGRPSPSAATLNKRGHPLIPPPLFLYGCSELQLTFHKFMKPRNRAPARCRGFHRLSQATTFHFPRWQATQRVARHELGVR